MKIYRAVRTNHLNQGFGLENTLPEVLAVYQSIGLKGHEGMDWGVSCHDYTVKHGGQCEPVYCDLDIPAKIKSISTDDNFGWGVVALTTEPDGIYEHLWWHLDAIAPNLKPGDVIQGGDVLGITGDTGRSTGAHLHRQLSPMIYDAQGIPRRKDVMNGYGGAIDPSPFLINQFILDITGVHVFMINMMFGEKSEEVMALQKRLIALGYDTLETGYYGEMTRQAVLKLQQDHQIGNPITIALLGGRYCGPKTRAFLNKIKI